jgi:hypothetical protein
MIVLLTTTFHGTALAITDQVCAFVSSSGKFGLFERSGKLSRFVTGQLLPNTIIISGTDFQDHREHVRENNFMFPSDTVPGMLTGIRFTYKDNYNDSIESLAPGYETHFFEIFQGRQVHWSPDDCLPFFKTLTRLEKLYRKLINRIISVQGVEYKIKSGFEAIRSLDGRKSHIRVKWDKTTKIIQLLGFGRDAINSYYVFDTGDLKEPKTQKLLLKFSAQMPWFPPFTPRRMNAMYSNHQEIYVAQIPTETGSTIEYSLNFYSSEDSRVFIRFYKVEMNAAKQGRNHNNESLLKVSGFVTGQIPVEDCGYVKYSFDGFRVHYDGVTFEDHWYWRSASMFLAGKEFKASQADSISSDAERIQSIYEKEFLGRPCTSHGTQGQLVHGFMWRSMDGSERHRVYLELKETYEIIGCVCE